MRKDLRDVNTVVDKETEKGLKNLIERVDEG